MLCVAILCGVACSQETGLDHGRSRSVPRIEVLPNEIVLPPNGSHQLNATVYNDDHQPITRMPVTWSSSDPAAATVDSSGNVVAVGAGTTTITASSGGIQASVSVIVGQPPTGTTIDIVSALTHQTMMGWEGTAQLGQGHCSTFNQYRAEVINRLANELGINRVRVELHSGTENTVDWVGGVRYGIINDNADPHVMDSAGFHFSQLDFAIDHIVEPMRQALTARGERLYVNLNYVDFGKSTFEHSSDPQEYGELLLAAFEHIRAKYGWVPDAVEAILEPDQTPNWRAREIGQAIVAAGDRLAAAGFRPAFIAPSNKNMTKALLAFDSMMAMPRVRDYLTDLAYHRYSGVSTATLAAIGERTRQFGIRTGMLEHLSADHHELHADLTAGRNSTWQRYTLAYCGKTPGGSYYWIDESNRSAPRVVLNEKVAFLSQYFRFVRFGAVRIGALSGDERFDPVAFRNTNGKHVVVVRATAGGSFGVRMLPPGTYGIKYTTSSAALVDQPDQTIAAGETLSTAIPAAGVLTIYQR